MVAGETHHFGGISRREIRIVPRFWSRIRSWLPLHRHLESGQCPRRRWGWGGLGKKGEGGGDAIFFNNATWG